MTPSAKDRSESFLMRHRALIALILLVAVALLFVACQPPAVPITPGPAATAAAGATATAAAGSTAAPSTSASPTINPNSIPLHPAAPTDPFSVFAFVFTPIFQALFILLVLFEQVTGNMAISIILITVLVRIAVVPLFRQQIVSQRRIQLLAPELKELQKRYKGDRTKMQQAQAEFYKERGVNPAAGCLPALLPMFLLLPMYSVFSSGLQNIDPNGMLQIFGIQIIHLNCPDAGISHVAAAIKPCINSVVLGIDLSQKNVLFDLGPIGLSPLAIASALLQLVQSRMMLPPAAAATDDPGSKAQRQTMLFIPLISVFYGGILPAGLFIYWIVSTLISAIQQYLIVGWGGMFPVFGWYPEWARAHTPRFPVAIPAPDPTKRSPSSVLTNTDERVVRAASTVRPRERNARQGRRGRRR